MPSSRQREASRSSPAEAQHHDDAARAGACAAAAPATRSKPSMSGMPASTQHERERAVLASRARSSASSASAPLCGFGRLHLPAAQHVDDDAGGSWRCRRRRARAGCFEAGRRRQRRPLGGPRLPAEPRREVERAAATGLALDPDAAAHHLDELRRDRQAQAGAAVAARRRAVGLRERLEDRRAACRPGCRCRCRRPLNCSSTSSARLPLGRDAHDDLAALGELDGVADQIQDHLPQADRRRRAGSRARSRRT